MIQKSTALAYCLMSGVMPAALGFSSEGSWLARSFDQTTALTNSAIVVTATFTNGSAASLRGFYYADQVPSGLDVSTLSVKLNGRAITNYTFESGQAGDVGAGGIPYRWVLERPAGLTEANPVSPQSSVQIVYSIRASAPGTFDLPQFSWAGYDPGNTNAAFGHSGNADQQSLTFTATNQTAILLLRVQAFGQGTLSPNYSNAWLEIGRRYTNTATGINGHVFTHWVISTNWAGGVASNTATLQFTMQSNLTLQVNFADVTKPTNTIILPTAGQRVLTNTPLFTVMGTARDNAQVSKVWCQLNGDGWSSAVTANNWSNWIAAVSMTPGTNVLKAYAVDVTGNKSLTNSVSFVYVLTAPLTVLTNGKGAVTPNYNGQLLELGKSYSMTATGAVGFAFVTWTGSLTTNYKTLTFAMQSNLSFTANFVDVQKPAVSITNPPAAKTYTNAQTVTISASGTDNVAVAIVAFYDGPTLKGTSTAPPYSYGWLLSAADNGPHAWTARAYDTAGNVATSSPVTLTVSIPMSPPTVAITTPTNGQRVSAGPFTVRGTANADAKVASVWCQINGGSWNVVTGTTNWAAAVTLVPGTNTLQVVAYDYTGHPVHDH